MPRTLDRSRPFGERIPPEDGCHFEQDGALFDSNGVMIREAAPAKPARPAVVRPTPPSAPEMGEAGDDFVAIEDLTYVQLRQAAKEVGAPPEIVLGKRDVILEWMRNEQFVRVARLAAA